MLRTFFCADRIVARCCVLLNGTTTNFAKRAQGATVSIKEPSSAAPQAPPTNAASNSIQARASSNYGNPPLSFRRNQGQTDSPTILAHLAWRHSILANLPGPRHLPPHYGRSLDVCREETGGTLEDIVMVTPLGMPPLLLTLAADVAPAAKSTSKPRSDL
jgi:hypothetical protein